MDKLEKQGYWAHQSGKDKSACPYEAGTPEAADWLSGWEIADLLYYDSQLHMDKAAYAAKE